MLSIKQEIPRYLFCVALASWFWGVAIVLLSTAGKMFILRGYSYVFLLIGLLYCLNGFGIKRLRRWSFVVDAVACIGSILLMFQFPLWIPSRISVMIFMSVSLIIAGLHLHVWPYLENGVEGYGSSTTNSSTIKNRTGIVVLVVVLCIFICFLCVTYVMERGKYPGLGVNQLHKDGITGKGVHVAIIDQPLLQNHLEYKEQLASYVEVNTGRAGPQMHGPAVASLFVGKSCGIAPEAILHYWAEPSWKRDYQYRCDALEQIIQYNKGLPKPEQIRVVSVSKGFSPKEPNLDRWKASLEEAKQSGIYVIHCSRDMSGACCPIVKNSDVYTNFQLCSFLILLSNIIKEF